MFNATLLRRQALRQLGSCAMGAVCTLAAAARAQAAAAPGQRVQWPEVALLGGGSFGPSQAEGRAVVAVFWSITCPFCRRHNEHVEKLHRAAVGKPLVVLGISRDTDAAAVARYARERGYTFPITLAEPVLFAQLGSRRVIPLTVVVGRSGRIQQSLPGEMFEEDVLELMEHAKRT